MSEPKPETKIKIDYNYAPTATEYIINLSDIVQADGDGGIEYNFMGAFRYVLEQEMDAMEESLEGE